MIKKQGQVFLSIFFGLIAVILPLGLAQLSQNWVNFTYGTLIQPFELFGFTASLWLVLLGWLRVRRVKTWQDAVPALLPVLVLFTFLTLIPELSGFGQSWDYQCYQKAAQALSQQINPYLGCYLYPPLLAQTFALFLGTAGKVINFYPIFGVLTASDLVFYIFQASQFFLLVFLVFLGERFMRMLGLNALVTALILAASLLFNNPLFRTIRHNQINLWVLDLSLVVLVFGLRYPILSGLSLALAAHLKIYALTMLGPLLSKKKWKISLTALLGILLLAILAPLTLWMQFGQSLIRGMPFDSLFRNNSLMGLSANFLHLIGLDFGLLPRILYLCLVIGALGLFILRYLQRERQSASSASKITAHLVDAMALSLLISPLVWEHHYIFALPLIWWAVVLIKGFHVDLSPNQISRPAILLAISALLMLVIPTFDLFPFSYHRLAGLCLWIWITMPGKIDLALQPHIPDYALG